MGAPRRGEAGFRLRIGRRRLLLCVPLGVAAAMALPGVSPAEGPTIAAAGPRSNGYYWSPSSASVAPGGAVTFKNGSLVEHGVEWTSGPESPQCNGVPVKEAKTNWSGSCTFAQAGTYVFRCPVHPTEMIGKIVVAEGGTTPPPPPPPGESPSESLLAGSVSQALRLAKSQHGGAVRGSIALTQAAAGGKLEVDLLARRAAVLGPGHAGTMRVGRLVRSYLKGGKAAFTVKLSRPARRMLAADGRLRLSVKIVVAPPQGEWLKLNRGVMLHA